MPVTTEELMLLLLHDNSRVSENVEFNKIVALLRKGDFKELFEHSWFKVFKCTPLSSFQAELVHLRDASADTDEIYRLKLLTTSVVFLYYFFQRNFMGPLDEESAFDIAFEFSDGEPNFINVDGEAVYHLVRDAGALFIVSEIFLGKADELRSYSTLSLWQQRYAIVHQNLITERAQTLQDIVEKATSELGDDLFVDLPELWCLRRLEIAQANLEFCNEVQAADLLRDVSKYLGFSVKLDGALGTRTHFQEKSIPQLTLKVERSKSSSISCLNPEDIAWLPKDVYLNNDTVLNQIKFDEEQENSRLNFVEQAVVLGISLLRKCLTASEELQEEEVMTHYSRLITDPQVWGIQYSALFLRSGIEIQKSRKAERALTQFQYLLDYIHIDKIPFSQRCHMVFACRIPPIWKLERDLANGYIALGLCKSALDIFKRLEMWEEVVTCYMSAKRSEDAENLLLDLLRTDESPLLYCLLGEVTNEPRNFEVAWTLSDGTYARAKRSLGAYHYQRKEYDRAIIHFRHALELNRLHFSSWHRLAFCFMKCQQYVECIWAYKQAVNINPDNFEAWNNMAKAYIHLKEKDKAWRVLQEALKCNYDDWRIWENYVLASMDVGAFNEVIKGWNRLLDLNQKFADGQLAHLLVKVVATNRQDVDGNHAAVYLRKKLFELFGRLTASIASNSDIWIAYGDLYVESEPADESLWPEHVQKTIQCYQKAIRCYMQTNAWEKNSDCVADVLQLLVKVWTVMKFLSERISPMEKDRLAASLEMTSKNTINLISKAVEYHSEKTRENIQQAIDKIESNY